MDTVYLATVKQPCYQLKIILIANKNKLSASADGRPIRRVSGLRLVLMAGVIFLAWLSSGTAHGEDSQLTESKLKAAFLFNFTKFVEWPPSAFTTADSPVVIGILGNNPFGDNLEAIIHDKKINDRIIVVKAMSSLAEVTNCQVLFISNSEKGKVSEIVAAIGRASILTVGDTDGFLEAGVTIDFTKEGNKVRFQINESASKRAGLKISSKLLSLASRTIH